MTLSNEQLVDVMLALLRGMSAWSWEGNPIRPWWELSDQEKTEILIALRKAHEEAIDRLNLESHTRALNRQFLDRFDLNSVRIEEQLHKESRQKMLAETAKKPNQAGARQAINDLLSQVVFMDATQRLAIERRLALHNLPSLGVLMASFRKQHEKILKRGKIRTEEEYYLVKEILDAVEFPVSKESRLRFAELLHDYEARLARS